MRIIGGSARGRQLTPIAGGGIRPTPDRVREALFSILYSYRGAFAGCTVLDLFAGSGALGIEALSRGADHAWFVDSSSQSTRTIRENLERCKLSAKATIVQSDVWSGLPSMVTHGPFDLIFADPPYGHDHAQRLLDASAGLGWLVSGGVFCLETATTDRVPSRSGAMQLFNQKRYGLTMLHFYNLPSEDQA